MTKSAVPEWPAVSAIPERPAVSQEPGGVSIKLGKLNGQGHTIIGTMGSTRPLQKVSIEADEFYGEDHLVAGAVEGFSELQILRRSVRLGEIMGESDV